MLKRHWIEDLNGWEGFTYLRLKGVPMKRSKDGGVIDFDRGKLERLIARSILERRVPIRGKELKLLRAVVRLSLNRFAQRLGLSHGAIYAWEKAERRRLAPINEVVVRLICAEDLGVQLPSRFTELVGDSRHEPIEVVLTTKKPTPKFVETREITRPSYRGHRKVIVKQDAG